MKQRKRTAATMTLIGTLWGVGCGGGTGGATTGQAPGAPATQGDETPAGASRVGMASRSGSGTVAATMGAAGGRLELSEGPRVVVPAGTISDPLEYVLQVSSKTTAFSNEESERPVGPTFSFAPGVESDGAPIEVSLALASIPEGWGEPALAYEYPIGDRVGAEDSVHTKWQYEDAKHAGGRITAQVDALPGMRLQFVLTNLEVQ